MAVLRTTLIDVGWGDSLLLESEDNHGISHYALIDSNDTSTLRSSSIFLRRFFERKNINVPTANPLFEWVLLTHAHADHGQGLKRILSDFGTLRLWYPDPRSKPAFFADLVRYSARSARVGQYDLIDTSKQLPSFGNASMQVLWPTPGLRPANENDNSVVLALTLNNVSFVLTGDAEADGVWTQIANQIPRNTLFFKVPHHGSDNGTFTTVGHSTPWLSRLPVSAQIAISSHLRPFSHPSPTVVGTLQRRGMIYRTDEHYHITVETNGQNVQVKYSHV